MIEGEELFVALNLMHGLNTQQTKELTEQGYLTSGIPANTAKANEVVTQFIEKYKLMIYQAMIESNNQPNEALKAAGLSRWETFDIIANELEEEGLFVKDKYGDFKAVIRR